MLAGVRALHRRIPSLFRRLPAADRYCSMLWRPWAYARAALRVPGVFPAALFVAVYAVLAHAWCRLYCGGWEPAWPARWRVYVLLLASVVVSAALSLLWLLASGLALPLLRQPRRTQQQGDYALLEQMVEQGGRNGDDGDDNDNDNDYNDEQERAADSPRVHARALALPRPQPAPGALPLGAKSWWWCVRVLACAAVACGGIWSAATYEHPGDIRYRADLQRALAHPRPEGYHNGERIFIAAAFYNNEEVLPHWSATLLKLVAFLGAENVFVSIVESNSDDGTRGLLRALDARLAEGGVARRVLVDDGAVARPAQMEWNARIEFLAGVRNRALEPLVERGGFARVLFSNDVFVEAESLIELLRTAEGEYDMACSLDFGHFGAYDAWVLRDRIGRLTSVQWPYFLDAADYEAMKAEAPVPVFACWNGVAVIAADPFVPVGLRGNGTLSRDALAGALPATHPAAHDAGMRGPSPALTPPVRFRASAAGECYSSECFLLPYDLRRQFGLERVFVNPRVQVAYAWRYYVWFKWVVRHWAVKWWVERVWDGAWMERAMMVVGDPKSVYTWDGGECHPWW